MGSTLGGEDAEQTSTKEVPCAYCNHNVVGTAFVLCAQCEIPLHRDCWSETRRCPAYACGSERTVDPAIAIFRKPPRPIGPVEEPVPALSQPGGSPDVGTNGIDPRTGKPSTLGTLTRILTSDKKISAVSIDLHLGESWLSHLTQIWPFGRRSAGDPTATAALAPSVPVLTTPAATGDERREIEFLERELSGLQHRLWVRRIGLVSGFLLAPLVLHSLGGKLFFPIVVALIAWATWPGWRARQAKRRERVLQERLDRLHLPPGKHR